MSEQAERTKAILSEAFTFRSVSSKNANFTSSIQGTTFYSAPIQILWQASFLFPLAARFPTLYL